MITINIDKAKEVAHRNRRDARAKEFQPHDEVIMKQIPGNSAAEAEAARQEIRDRYTDVQSQINQATSVEELYPIMSELSQIITG